LERTRQFFFWQCAEKNSFVRRRSTDLLIFAGYIHRRLRDASRLAAKIGSFAFGTGVLLLILTAFIVSPSHPKISILPRFHEICARTAAVGIGAGLLFFC
jgi:hypothetical protein